MCDLLSEVSHSKRLDCCGCRPFFSSRPLSYGSYSKHSHTKHKKRILKRASIRTQFEYGNAKATKEYFPPSPYISLPLKQKKKRQLAHSRITRTQRPVSYKTNVISQLLLFRLNLAHDQEARHVHRQGGARERHKAVLGTRHELVSAGTVFTFWSLVGRGANACGDGRE